MISYTRIIDISRPVNSSSACFPGDVPFSRSITLSYAASKIVNLTSLTMSPHVGTHADAPAHIKGDLASGQDLVGDLVLEPYLGACRVFDLAPFDGELKVEQVDALANAVAPLPERVLFRTQPRVDHAVFEKNGSYFSPEFVREMARRGVRLLGIDTASVDRTDSQTLDAHHALDEANMFWLENLDLSDVASGDYFLIALPVKFTELEASPVRAVLLV